MSVRTGLAGLLLSVTVACTASAADVTVRVEGATQTLVAPTIVSPSDAVTVDKTSSGGTTCQGSSGGGALELATGGDWGGRAFGTSQAIEFIKGEAYPFSQNGKFWSLYVNHTPSAVGICDVTPVTGDEILLFAACINATSGCFSEDPLDVSAPTTVKPGAAFDVMVDEYTSPFGETPTKAPAAGATVLGAGANGITGSDGVTTLSLTQRGPVVLTATKGARVRDEATVCVTDGGDGACGSPNAIPGGPVTTPTPVPGAGGGPSVDTAAPVSKIRGITEQQRFKRRTGPRTLEAAVADAGGIADVKLALTRKRGHTCSAFSGSKERFRRVRCGRHPAFSIGERGAVSFLLPARLKAGRYVLDVVGIDRAGNRERLYRGRNRVVFRVR